MRRTTWIAIIIFIVFCLLLMAYDVFGAITISVDENHTGHFISSVHDPVLAQDVATKHYADQLTVTFNAVIFKGVIDCSTNPNYPAADRGWAWIISVAGKIGGASGLSVVPRDLIICLDNGTPSGDQATVGSHWTLIHSTAGNTILGPASSTDNDFVQWDGVTGLLVKDAGLSFSTDGTLAANSDLKIPSQKAVKTYVDASVPATGNLTDAGTDGLTVTGGTGAVIGSGTSLSQHVSDSSHNGYLSSTDWTTFNSKQSTLTLGNLTDVGTDGITVTGGTGSVVGSGTSLSQHVADTTHGGYLSSTDWNTFNSGVVTPAALTKTDDTNVTLTLGGSPSTALVNAASLTLGWSGQLAVSRGGTGAATFAAHKFFGNDTGSTAAPGVQDIKEADLVLADNTTNDVTTSAHGFAPKGTAGTTQYWRQDWTLGTPAGAGTVTSFSSGNLSPLFTTSVATSTTTPALTFSLSNSAAHTFLANNTGSSGAPSYTSFVSGTDYAPSTSGSSILYGNGSGGFSNVTIGSNLTFSGGTLAATGGGGSGTVTSIATTSPITGGTITTTGTIDFDHTVDLVMTAAQTETLTNSTTSAIDPVLNLRHDSSGTPAAGFGGSLYYYLKSSTTLDRLAAHIDALWTTATDASRKSAIAIATTGGEIGRFSNGGFSVGSTTDPGAGIINANNGFWTGNAAATNGHFLISGGSFYGISTITLPTSVVVANDILQATGTTTFVAQKLKGTTTNDSGTTGQVGEEFESLIASGSATSLTTATAKNITSISLTAGDWDVSGIVNFTETTSTVTARSAGVTTTSATIPTDGSEGYCGVQSTVTSETNSITLPTKRISLSGTTTTYLVGSATFSAGTCSAFGQIVARRRR